MGVEVLECVNVGVEDNDGVRVGMTVSVFV